MFPARSPSHCKDKACPLCCLEMKFFSQLYLLSDSLEELSFPVSPAVNCPDFAATVTAFFCPLTSEEFFLQHLHTAFAG